MGRKGIDTESARQVAQIHSSELFRRANMFLSSLGIRPTPTGVVSTETPLGAEIMRVQDQLSLSAEFVDGLGNPYELEVEYPVDTRRLPDVWLNYPQYSRTVSVHQFPKILGDMIELIPQVQ